MDRRWDDGARLAIVTPGLTLPASIMRYIWRTLNVLMGLQFLFAAALQYNDADPFRWAVIYVAAALPCCLVVARRPSRWWPAVVGAVSLAWAVTYLARGVPSVSPIHMFDEWEMKNQQVVETRELFGLLIVATWMLALIVADWRARRRATAS